jgi:hypothetical protein
MRYAMTRTGGTKRRDSKSLFSIACIAAVCIAYGDARADQEVVTLNHIAKVLNSVLPTNTQCQPWSNGAPNADACTCCLTHKYISNPATNSNGGGGLEAQCLAPIGGVNYCTAPIINNNLNGGAADATRAERIAMRTLAAKRYTVGSVMHGGGAPLNADLWAAPNPGDTRPGNHADVASLMNLLDAAHAGALPFPPVAHDPFINGGHQINRPCVRVKGGKTGVFTLRLYSIQYSHACEQAGNNPAGVNDWGMTYIVKVLLSPQGELANLEQLKADLTLNQYPGFGNGNPLGNLPAVIVPTGSLSYVTPGGIRRYLTIMPVAPGQSLDKFASAMTPGTPPGPRVANPPWLPPQPASVTQLSDAWTAVGRSLATFHSRFMAPRAPGGAILRPTVVHGDFHQENVFYHPVTHQVSFIDAESMAGTMHARIANGAGGAGTAAPWFDYIRPFNFSCCLDNMARLYAWYEDTNVPPVFNDNLLNGIEKRDIAELTIRPFLRAYANEIVATSGGAVNPAPHADWQTLKNEIWATFDHTAAGIRRRMGYGPFAAPRPEGVKDALYSPGRYLLWKRQIRAVLAAGQGGI